MCYGITRQLPPIVNNSDAMSNLIIILCAFGNQTVILADMQTAVTKPINHATFMRHQYSKTIDFKEHLGIITPANVFPTTLLQRNQLFSNVLQCFERHFKELGAVLLQ